MGAANYTDTLTATGPFTLLGPSNDAFIQAGYTSGASVIRAADSMRVALPYHILRGKVLLDALPLAFNQPFTAANGQPLFITHWMNARDTAVIVNGIRVSTRDKAASNGLVNIIDGLLYPNAYTNVQQAVSGTPALSFFNAAIIRSGLAQAYQSGGPYTVFAPENAAFTAIGIPSTDSIYNMDPAVLQNIVKAHITNGRNFVYDYILKADVSTNTYQEQMLGGQQATISLLPDNTQPGRFSGINIRLNSDNNTGIARLSRRNILAGNGVVHSISSILIQ
jgi:uncharacterized surface protein with fasciclin (FAS1) repeats